MRRSQTRLTTLRSPSVTARPWRTNHIVGVGSVGSLPRTNHQRSRNHTTGALGDPQPAPTGSHKMGQWYMEASHLNDRQVLRRLQRCASVQRALTRSVSSRVLAQVTEVVTRDLQRGQWGRTTWLQWLLGMVAQKHGEEHASDVLKTIKGWRWMIDRHQGPATTNTAAANNAAVKDEPWDA
jgi:hypothetical protein